MDMLALHGSSATWLGSLCIRPMCPVRSPSQSSLLPAALLRVRGLIEQHQPQVGAVWQPQRHAACGHLLAGAAGGSPGGGRAVERPEHAAKAADTPRGPEPPEEHTEGRCGGNHARTCHGGRRKKGRLRKDAGGLKSALMQAPAPGGGHGRVHGQRLRSRGMLRQVHWVH